MEEKLGKGIYYQIRDGTRVSSKISIEDIKKTIEKFVKVIESYLKHEEDNEKDETILPKD